MFDLTLMMLRASLHQLLPHDARPDSPTAAPQVVLELLCFSPLPLSLPLSLSLSRGHAAGGAGGAGGVRAVAGRAAPAMAPGTPCFADISLSFALCVLSAGGELVSSLAMKPTGLQGSVAATGGHLLAIFCVHSLLVTLLVGMG